MSLGLLVIIGGWGLSLISRFRRSRKGSWIDTFFIIAIMFGVAVAFLVGWLLISNVNTEFQSKLSSAEAKSIMSESKDRYVGLFDGIFLFVFFGSFIATIIGSLFVDTHPAFFFISLVLLVFACVLGAVFANAYDDIASSDGFSAFSSDFTYIPFVMQYYVHIIIFMVCAISIALYAKSRLL